MKLLAFLLTVLSTQSLFAAPLAKYLIQPKNMAQLEALSGSFEVVNRAEDGFEIIVPGSSLLTLEFLAPTAQLLDPDIEARANQRYEEFSNQYMNWPKVRAWMEELPQRFPEFVQLEKYGESRLGKPLYSLRLTQLASAVKTKPKLMITSATHGDELITVEVVHRIIEELLAADSERLQNMLATKDLYFIPVVNPDGYQRRRRYSGNVDPNRAYPHPLTGKKRSQINCTDAVIDYHDRSDFAGSMDIHAYGKMVMYPWAYTYDSPQDDRMFSDWVNHLAEHNRYRAGQISKVIYTAPGSSADYYYWKKGTKALAIEIADRKVPNPSEFPKVMRNVREMMWRFIESF